MESPISAFIVAIQEWAATDVSRICFSSLLVFEFMGHSAVEPVLQHALSSSPSRASERVFPFKSYSQKSESRR